MEAKKKGSDSEGVRERDGFEEEEGVDIKLNIIIIGQERFQEK